MYFIIDFSEEMIMTGGSSDRKIQNCGTLSRVCFSTETPIFLCART